MHVETSQLPRAIQAALAEVGYGRKDIGVSAAESFTPSVGGGQGYKGFCAIVDLATGERRVSWGSWGGSNMFNPTNIVDLDTEAKPLLPNLAVIKGQIGGGHPAYASVTVHPSTLAPLLPPATDVTAQEKRACAIIAGYKSFARAEYFASAGLGEYGPTNPVIVACAAKGLVKVNKGGAVAITTAGRNAR